jgi:hypothetical protein
MAQAYYIRTFAECKNVSDVIAQLSDMQAVGGRLMTSSGRPRGADDLIRDVMIGAGAAEAYLGLGLPRPELTQKIDSHIKVITEGGPRLQLRSTIQRILLQADAERRPLIMPWELAGKLVGDKTELGLKNRVLADSNLPDRQFQWPTYDDVTSLNELMSLIYRDYGRSNVAEELSAERIIQQLKRDYDKAARQPGEATTQIRQSDMARAFVRLMRTRPTLNQSLYEVAAGLRDPHPEVHAASPETEFLRHDAPPPKSHQAERAAVVPVAARVRKRVVPADQITSPRLRYLSAALGATGLTVAACGGAGTMLYLRGKELDETGLHLLGRHQPPADWKPCTSEQFAKIVAQKDGVRAHQWRFAETLARGAQTGLTKDGAISHDQMQVVASLAVVDEDVDNFFDLHALTNDRILCYEDRPTIVTGPDGSRVLDLPPVASMHQGGTTDNIADDVMGYNTYWLQRDAPLPLSSSIWHEMGHKYRGGDRHEGEVAELNRYDDEYTLTILRDGDYSYYISLLVDTADKIVDTYVARIRADMKKSQSASPEQLQLLAAQYKNEPNE